MLRTQVRWNAQDVLLAGIQRRRRTYACRVTLANTAKWVGAFVLSVKEAKFQAPQHKNLACNATRASFRVQKERCARNVIVVSSPRPGFLTGFMKLLKQQEQMPATTVSALLAVTRGWSSLALHQPPLVRVRYVQRASISPLQVHGILHAPLAKAAPLAVPELAAETSSLAIALSAPQASTKKQVSN
jgi:hypothetical protein